MHSFALKLAVIHLHPFFLSKMLILMYMMDIFQLCFATVSLCEPTLMMHHDARLLIGAN